jgi:hypothetical protein
VKKHPLLKKSYQFGRAILDTLQFGQPQCEAERSRHEQIKAQWGNKATPVMEPGHAVNPTRLSFKGEANKSCFIPFSKLGRFERAYLAGGTFQTISGVDPRYTTGVIAHNKCFQAGATLLENCQGQIILSGTATLPVATFSATTGGTQQTATCTTTAGSTTVTTASTATMAAGMMVSGTGIQPSTVIAVVVNATTLALNNPAIASGSVSLTFYAVVDGVTAATNSPPVFVGGSVGSAPMVFQPLRLSFKFNCSKQLLAQSPTLFVPVLQNQISRGISSMLDNMALFGTGPANGQPLGLFAATGSPVKLSTPMSWPNYQTYRTTILQTDIDPDSYGGVLSPGMLSYLDSTQFATNASYTIWEKMKDGDMQNRFFVGNEINSSTAMNTGTGMFLGCWRFLYVMIWAEGLEVVFDPYSMADSSEMVIRANILANVGCTFPTAFTAIWQ